MFIKLAYYLLAVSLFFFITVGFYYKGDSPMSMEKNFMPLSFFVCLPFVKEFLFKFSKAGTLKFLFVLTALGISIYNIYDEVDIYRARLKYFDRVIRYSAGFHERKFIIEKKNVDMGKIIIPWAVSVETLMYSSMDSPDSSRTFFITEDPVKYKSLVGKQDLFLCTYFWPEWSVKGLNHGYFRLPEEKYQVIPSVIP